MNVKELREKLFAELAAMSKEDVIRELEGAGFVIRYDLEGSGILNPDGTIMKRDRDISSKSTMYSVNEDFNCLMYPGYQNLSPLIDHEVYGNPNNTKYSVVSPWIESEGCKGWTSSPNPNLRNAS